MGEEVNATRKLANTPGSDMTPAHLADAARMVARENNITAKILDKKEMTRLGMGGVLGVAPAVAVGGDVGFGALPQGTKKSP